MIFRGNRSEGRATEQSGDRRYICYLSLGKIDTLYAQNTDFVQSHVKQTKKLEVEGKTEVGLPSVFGLVKNGLSFGGRRGSEYVVEGEISPVQRLQKIIAVYESNNLIGDLNEDILLGDSEPGNVCFAYSGAFTCVDRAELMGTPSVPQTYLRQEEEETKYSPTASGMPTIGRMCVLMSEFAGYRIFLACSMKYFSDMGGSRIEGKDGDVVDIHPHSGNHFFFAGNYSAHFEAILFLTGQSGKDLYGSPVALINSFTPDLRI